MLDAADATLMIDPHRRQERARDAVHRAHVEVDREVERDLVALKDRPVVDEAGGVEEDVDGALRVRLDRRCEHRARIGDVKAPRLAAGRACELGERLRVDVGGDDASALADERFGGGTADALPGRGDERRLAGEAIGHGQRSVGGG
jgi:hypothetical protein